MINNRFNVVYHLLYTVFLWVGCHYKNKLVFLQKNKNYGRIIKNIKRTKLK
jgi:hypothetical protein